MSNLSQPTTSDKDNKHETMWSRSERATARRVFDAVLRRELQELMQDTKLMASRIKEAPDLWELELYLTRRRKEIDRKYEWRTSRLLRVFGRLLHEGRLKKEDLRGLGEDKLASIRSCAEFFDESDAA
jgi:hypothetical protein